MRTVLVWSIAAGSIAGVLFRPRDWSEAVWACLGASLLVASGLLPWGDAAAAVGKGTDVYLFLTGMMLLSELARREGVFDWLATIAVRAAKGSAKRLFLLVYLVGTAVTIFLSNDATAVVLTPAVYAAVQKAKTKALPYLFICAFIANAASFVLPISNPANLVVYGHNLPPLVPWLQKFFVPSVCAVLTTYLALRWAVRGAVSDSVESDADEASLSKNGQLVAWGIVGTGILLLVVSARGLDLGVPTFVAGVLVVLLTTRFRIRRMVDVGRSVSWNVLPLVGGLFVLVEALNKAGAMRDLHSLLEHCTAMGTVAGSLAVSFGIAALSNVMNNLPSGLLAGAAVQVGHVPAHIRDAVLLGVDLGPNLSVTGSLATVLWLIALRREGERVSGWQFLKVGMIVMPPALLLSTMAMSLLST